MAGSIGNRVNTKIVRPPKELVEKFRGIATPLIADNMNRLFCMDQAIKPLNGVPLLGVAVTVRAPIGDNLMFHQALQMAQEGDVIVVDGQGGMERSLSGDIMASFAAEKKLAGFVLDGCNRDLEGLQEIPIAVYARGLTPAGPFKNGPGEVNFPIACGGQVVRPGDILVGDRDGVVVIRPEDAEELHALCVAKINAEDVMKDEIKRHCCDWSWVSNAVKAKNVLMMEE